MKAVRITNPGEIEVCTLQEPPMGAEELRVRVKVLGLCGTDLATYRGVNPLVGYPRIPGHEIAAEIVDRGADVPKEFEIGSPVTVTPYTTCGICSSCLAGRVNCCKNNQTLGVQRDGAATELLAVHHSKVIMCRSGRFTRYIQRSRGARVLCRESRVHRIHKKTR